MMSPTEFIKTLYLGDRACKRIIVDGWGKRLALQVDRISRVRSLSGKWEFYDAEDIVDGMIIFEGLSSFEFSPPGFIPSDWIEFVSVDPCNDSTDETRFKATLSLGAIDKAGNSKEITLTVCASSIHLEDSNRPGSKIVE